MENVPSTSQECPTTGPIYNLRPFTRKGPRQKRFPAQLSRSHSVAQSFTKEVILLPDHLTTHVPRRNKKAWLFENGHIKSALEFSCDWDSDKVMQAIRTAFQQVVEGCRLQILLACHTKLVEPSLTSKQTLNGDLVRKNCVIRSEFMSDYLKLKVMSLWKIFLFSALDVTAFQPWVFSKAKPWVHH